MNWKYALNRGRSIPVWSLLAVVLTLPGSPLRAAPEEEAGPKGSPPKATGTSSDGLDERVLLGAARNAVHRGDLETAEKRFRRLLEMSPDQDQARLEYAGLLSQMDRPAEAKQEYERLLRKRPDDLSLVRSLVDVLLSLGEHPRVRSLLEPIVAAHPDRVDFALVLAKIYALDGDLDKAREIAETRIEGKPLTNDRMRLDAVELFTQLQRPEPAKEPLRELLRTRPNDPRVVAAEIRYLILSKHWKSAFQKIRRFEQLHPGQHDVQIELASALYAAGFYSEAGEVYDSLLPKLPQNRAVLLGSARVALRYNRLRRAAAFIEQVPIASRGRTWSLTRAEFDIVAGNYRHAEEVLQGLLNENPKDRQAALSLADTERAQQEFLKADARYEALGARKGDRTAALHLAESLVLQKRFGEAAYYCREVLSEAPEDVDGLRQLGKVLAAQGRITEALPYLEKAGTITNDPLPEYVYYTHLIHGDPPTCYTASASAAKRPLDSIAVMFGLALREGRKGLARCILDAGLEIAPDNVALQTHMAQWYASYGTRPCAAEAAGRYRRLLAGDLDNQKWLLGLARAEATRRCYESSLAAYARLHREQPSNYQIAREQVRVISGIDGTMEALRRYDCLVAGWPGLSEERRRLCIERNAKALQTPNPTAASNFYESLSTAEPYEQHFRFELGQAYGATGNTPYAIATYSNLLAFDPNHRNAEVALEGKWLALQNRVFGDYRFRRERGRNGLTSIDRGGAFTGIRHVFDCEDEFLSIAYGRLTLAPTLGEGTAGNCLQIDFQHRLPSGCLRRTVPNGTPYVFVDGCIEAYDRLVSTRPTGLAGLKWRAPDDTIWTFAGSLENVLENHESLRQDVYRGGLLLGMETIPAPYWELTLSYEYDAYSDANNRHAAQMRNRIKLTPDPDRLSLLVNMDYWDFAEPSVFSSGPDPYFDMQHPYFSPRNFVQTDVGIEWKHCFGLGAAPSHGRLLPDRLVAPGLSCQRAGSRYGDRFDGADQWWISLSARKRWDSQNKNYTVLDGLLVWDITRRLSGYAKAEYLESSVYQSTGAYAGLAWIY